MRTVATSGPLPSEVARQFLDAQFHQCQPLRRYGADFGRLPGDRNQRTLGTAAGCHGGLVPAQKLPAQGLKIAPDRAVMLTKITQFENPLFRAGTYIPAIRASAETFVRDECVFRT